MGLPICRPLDFQKETISGNSQTFGSRDGFQMAAGWLGAGLARPGRRLKAPGEGSPLLENARKTEFQLWAENAPFEFKDVLKGRGYRWDGASRCWYIILDEAALPAEEEFLLREVCPGRSVPFRRDKITARNRFSLMPS